MDASPGAASDDLAFRVIAAILEDEGCRLATRVEDGVVVADIILCTDDEVIFANYAKGATPGAAALAAYRRYAAQCLAT